MAVYRFSALRDGQSVSFRPTADVLSFDQSSISAADIRVTASGSHTRIEWGSKDILLLNTSPLQLATSNVTFANGSRLLVGDNSTAMGDNGPNTLIGTSGRDHLIGMDGDDFLNGGAGADRLDGGLGNDYYVVTCGDVVVDTGGARDAVSASVSWTLAPGLELLWLTGSAVQGVGNDGYNEINGNAASNILSGRGGDDALWGQGGNDTFNMSLGATSSYGNDYIDGGEGVDTLDFGANARSWVSLSLREGHAFGGGHNGAGTVSFARIENVVGGSYSDWLAGDVFANFIYGGSGDDTIEGDSGSDVLEGGNGNDRIMGNNDPDRLYGGSGNDSLYGGDEGGDTDGNGNDQLWGDAGNDFLRGGAGADRLNGGAGNDTLQGGPSSDWADDGSDVFVFAATPGTANADRIVDFDAWGVDKLAFVRSFHSSIGAMGNFQAGDARFWAAPGATRGHDSTDRIVYDTSSGNLYYDSDGSGSRAAQLVATFWWEQPDARDIVVI